ncbi:MAG: hypothetical protein AAFX50_06100, partial [Acidobacteriota bacterium]
MAHRLRPLFESSPDPSCAVAGPPTPRVEPAGPAPDDAPRPAASGSPVDDGPPPWTLPWGTAGGPAPCPSTAGR